MARTSNVWDATVNDEYALGLVQEPQVPASIRHSNVPLSDEENENDALVLVVGFGGLPVIVVLGAAVSTVQVYVTGVAS